MAILSSLEIPSSYNLLKAAILNRAIAAGPSIWLKSALVKLSSIFYLVPGSSFVLKSKTTSSNLADVANIFVE